MGKRITTEVFIERAKAVHGNRYDYSKAEYKRIHDYVTIICPEHGEFQQSPANHYAGKGCSDCGGSKPHTTETFIEAAQGVHEEQYDYSKVKYQNNREHITIICPDHGPFSQSGKSHLRGNGCPECGGCKRHDTASFIEKARDVHGDRYDYSQVEYKDAHTKVVIVCSEHGAFNQTPTNHFSGNGCPTCGDQQCSEALRSNTDQFIAKAQAIHGDRYEYSMVDYKRNNIRVVIICPDHGPFEQMPSEHLVGSGCNECGVLATAEARRKTTKEFIAEAKKVHDNHYDYSFVEYLHGSEKVTIICPEHGPFNQTPNGHVQGKGCYECGVIANGDAKRHTTKQFISKARMLHGDKYDYSLVHYLRVKDKVTIICPEHGPFAQTANDHLSQGSGCPDCAETGFNPKKPGLLYYLAVMTDEGKTLYKIGITNLTVEKRFRLSDLARIRVIKTWRFPIGHDASKLEAEILGRFIGDRYWGPEVLVSAGNTELFIRDVLELDVSGDEISNKPVIDHHAHLIGQPKQLEFGFMGE